MHRLAVCLSLILLSVLVVAQNDSLDSIRKMRLEGRLSEALSVATTLVESSNGETAFLLHLELAKIHDRIGLHTNTRPVAAALHHIERADYLAGYNDRAQAHAELAYAEYFYRSEMSERIFETATKHAKTALTTCEQLGDIHCQADAVHRLGLIKLQQRELQSAHELFKESLRLDRIEGERALLRADYERHVGFVYALQDNVAASLPYFERSLKFRVDAGAIDASMFAAISLASALVELGRGDEARPHIDYAMRIANDIGSDTGLSRAENVLAKL